MSIALARVFERETIVPLRVELKPFERIVIGETVLVNSGTRTSFLIDVLQTGSSNLTLADTNEEAANSQALSTRQSIAVSALALANQSQQSVLQLLR